MSLSSWGRSSHMSSPNGRSRGRGLHQYSSLSSHDLGDEIPLMSADEAHGGGEEEGWESSSEEEDVLEQSRWVSRRRWQQRIKNHSGLVGWFFDGGWQLLLKK